tara:strand:- start:6190 stop:6624 length:435 start_codon:yes stop_codon:yes gene_type:complete
MKLVKSLSTVACVIGLSLASTSSVLAASSTSVVGTWRNHVNWNCNSAGSTPITAALFTINADGTWSYPYGGGNWWQEEGLVIISFDSHPTLQYVGNVTKDAVVGIQGYSDNPGSRGCFYLLREQAGKASDVKHYVDGKDAVTNR